MLAFEWSVESITGDDSPTLSILSLKYGPHDDVCFALDLGMPFLLLLNLCIDGLLRFTS